MSSAGDVLRLRESLSGKLDEREPIPQRFRATMGDGTGAVVVPGKPNYVYVRRLGRGLIEECLNNKAAARDGLPIIAGYSHESPDVLQVLEVDWYSFSAPGAYPYTQHHHDAHELHNVIGGDDVVWVQSQQLMPLLVYPTSPATMRVNVFGGWYPWASGWHYFEPALSADLTAHVPALAANARYVLISIDGATEALQYTAGAVFSIFMPPVDAENRVPAPPAGSIPIGAVYLPNGTTAIDWDNLYDMRLFNQPMGGSITPGVHALLDATVHSGTATDIPSQGSLIIGNATPAWDELVHPGAAGYALVSGAATFAWSLTPTWLGTHTWGSGFNLLPTDATGQALGAAGTRWDLHTQDVYFEGATGSNVITITDNLADALHVVDTGDGDIFLQIVTTTGSEEIILNAGGDDVDFTAQAVGVADALQVRGNDGQITLGVLTAGFVKSSAGGVLSVALEVALAELAGYVRGSIIRGGAADWEALAHPGAAGYALISDATDIVWDQTPAWTGEHSFGAGIAFTGASGANEITVPDNIAIALELLDAGGLEYMRVVSTNANPYLLIDPAAAGIKVGIGCSTPDQVLESFHSENITAHNVYRYPLKLTVYDNAGGFWSNQGSGVQFEIDAVGSAGAVVAEVVGAGDGATSADGQLIFRINQANTMTTIMTIIDSRVGVGTILPTSLVEIEGMGYTKALALQLHGATYSSIFFMNDNVNVDARNWGLFVPHTTFGTLEFRVGNAQGSDPQTAGSTVVTFDKDGNVGVGTTGPLARFEVNGDATDDPLTILDALSDNDSAFINFKGASEAGVTKSISTSAVGVYAGRIRIQINGTDRWIPFYVT